MTKKHDPVVYYVFKPGYNDIIKIGTTNNLEYRLNRMRKTYGHDDLIVLVTEPGDEKLEKQRHTQFSDARLIGDWFFATNELRNHIASLSNEVIYGYWENP